MTVSSTPSKPTSQAEGVRADPPDETARRAAAGIELQGLSKHFAPDAIALDGVDLSIPAGEFFTLLGPSGCGKTTLLRLIAGLEATTSGTVEIGGRAVTEAPAHKRNVNTVFQSYALFDHLNVADNIGFGLRMQRVARAEITRRVAETAAFIKIDNLLGRRVDQLSGGQRQRVALARALVNEPDVLLLDEPLSALDAGLRSDLQLELMRIQRRLGMTFVFVTHDQQEAMVMSDRVAVLDAGRIQQVGSPQALYEHPENLFVARFMGHENLFEIVDRDEAGVVLSFGRLNGRFTAGTHLLIRPETMTVTRDDESVATADNTLRARVAERVYRGHVAEYGLTLADGTVLVATCNNLGEPMFDVGTEVCVSIRTSGVVAFHA
ncbi:ABC transporter ATP-binding protein [Salinisphaera sp. Q1T1-3]|uniref:ABC transporter ATP-binding protein n=1 Tax=Salinisphaera sp. Q1T1-3 TaxID=2321229 RepID=UPI000E75E8EE|nr:ABC transporter ATP-binding protein [Salinisphaera sp. Q1T1-3]RJS93296.1 ABC transporter ATP-binding protein [Salinisphaera sp. Q1T1-3]